MPYGLWFGLRAVTPTAMVWQACFVLQIDGASSVRGIGCVLGRFWKFLIQWTSQSMILAKHMGRTCAKTPSFPFCYFLSQTESSLLELKLTVHTKQSWTQPLAWLLCSITG